MKRTMKWPVLLLFGVISAEIPAHIRHRMKHAHSFADLLDSVHVEYHPETTNVKHRQAVQASSIRTGRILGASLMRSPSRARGMAMEASGSGVAALANDHVDAHTSEHLDEIWSMRQGNDTCRLQSVCVPVPIEEENPQVVIYPRCYEVMQCVGSCCERNAKCRPHSIKKVLRPIAEMLYIGHDKFMLNQTINIEMEEHTSCSCYDCEGQVPECPLGHVINSNCQCECANPDDKQACQGTHPSLPPHTHTTEGVETGEIEAPTEQPSTTTSTTTQPIVVGGIGIGGQQRRTELVREERVWGESVVRTHSHRHRGHDRHAHRGHH